VRVNPNEVHIRDPGFFGEIYHSKGYKTDRDAWYTLEYLGQGISFTIGHELHALRRNAMSSYFSMASIRALETRIQAVAKRMLDRLHDAHTSGQIIPLRYVFSAFSVDIVTAYAFGKENAQDLMSNPEYGRVWTETVDGQIPMNSISRQFPWLIRLMMAMPTQLMTIMNPQLKSFMDYNDGLLKQVQKILMAGKAEKDGIEKLDQQTLGSGPVTILHELAFSDLPARERQPTRLQGEASLIVGAGGETTASTLTRTIVSILENPSVLERLQGELKAKFKNPDEMPSIDELSNLEYLNAVVEEGVRISFPVLARSPRIFQTHALHYKNWVIPAGVSEPNQPTFRRF
jgi:cytochrome P450